MVHAVRTEAFRSTRVKTTEHVKAALVATEGRRQAIQSAIDATRSSAERNRLGQFATPNALAIDIAQYVESLIDDRNRVIHFADPSLGTGSFFSAALAVFGPRRIKSAIGIEVDPVFCNAAHNLWTEAGLNVMCGDFTRVVASGSCPSAPNLVLANPPYVRHHHFDRADKEHLQRLTERMAGVQVNGLAGLYVYFLLLATAWMEDGGYAAWLIPSEFMDVNYGIALKRFLTDRVTLIRAHRFDPDDVQFDDALVSSVVLVFRKVIPPNGHAVAFTFGGTMAEPHVSDQIPLETLRKSRKWTVLPDHANSDRCILDKGDGPDAGGLLPYPARDCHRQQQILHPRPRRRHAPRPPELLPPTDPTKPTPPTGEGHRVGRRRLSAD